MACSANAQSVEKAWEVSMKNYTAVQTRSIGAVGKTALVPNNETGKLEVWDATGKIKEYDVLTFLKEKGGESTAMGRGVSTDEAGNIIMNVNFPSMSSCRTFVAIKPDGSMLYIPCEIPSGTDFAEGTSGRCDFLGDKTAGDVTNNAYIFTAPNACSYGFVFNIFEGEQDTDFSYGVKIGDAENTEQWNTESTIIPIAKLAEDAENAPKFVAKNRSIAMLRVSADGKSAMEKSAVDFGKATTTNFTAFTVDGVEYVVVNKPDGDARTHSWELCKLSDGSCVYRWTMPAGEAANYMVGFASTVNEDGTVNIFQFNPGIRLAMYTFNPNGSSGINDINADDNAPVEYYNLQGVKVANPEGGIFIKKQGNKTEKFIAE